MPTNFYMYFVSALIPLVVGAIYYSPKVFGGTWMKINGFTDETLKQGNPAVIYGLTYVLGVFLSVLLSGLVIHQSGVVASAMTGAGEFTPDAVRDVNAFLAEYGNTYRTFGHGAVHGVLLSLFFALPVIAINGMFERRGAKYIFIHWGYWAVTLALMGGLLCQTLVYPPLS